jgi:hypothetical protein
VNRQRRAERSDRPSRAPFRPGAGSLRLRPTTLGIDLHTAAARQRRAHPRHQRASLTQAVEFPNTHSMNDSADFEAAKRRLASAESFARSKMSGQLIQAKVHAEAALAAAVYRNGPEWDALRARARSLLTEIEQKQQLDRTQSRGHGRGRWGAVQASQCRERRTTTDSACMM